MNKSKGIVFGQLLLGKVLVLKGLTDNDIIFPVYLKEKFKNYYYNLNPVVQGTPSSYYVEPYSRSRYPHLGFKVLYHDTSINKKHPDIFTIKGCVEKINDDHYIIRDRKNYIILYFDLQDPDIEVNQYREFVCERINDYLVTSYAI